jgi:hypothetical protein
LLSLAALASPNFLPAQTNPDLSRILERLDRLEQENRTLAGEVQALRAELAASRQPSASPGAPASVPAVSESGVSVASAEERLDIQQARIDEQAQTKVEAGQKFPIRLAGMVLFNAFMNSKQSGGVDYPIVAAATGPGHDGASVRQSIVGLEFAGPQSFWGGNAHASVYMDFFAGANNSAMRIRTVSVGVDWRTRSIAAGLEKPIFNPREPSSLAQVGISPLTGAGNLWLWLPQVRVEQELRFSAHTGLRAQIGAVQTREIGPYVGTVTPEAARPAAEGRFNFHHSFDEDRRLEFATGFHTSVTHAGGRSIPSNLYSFDWFYNPWKQVEFTGVFYSGQNVAHLGSGTRQGFAIYRNYAYAVESKGGWGQLTLHALPRLDFHFFTGQVDDSNHDLGTGSIGKNLLYGGNAYFRLAPNVLMGIETTQIRTMYIGQGIRLNNHYDLALAYIF